MKLTRTFSGMRVYLILFLLCSFAGAYSQNTPTPIIKLKKADLISKKTATELIPGLPAEFVFVGYELFMKVNDKPVVIHNTRDEFGERILDEFKNKKENETIYITVSYIDKRVNPKKTLKKSVEIKIIP